MRTMLQRLLKHPHRAVFDTSPRAVQAFRLSHPDGAAWAIADEVMTITAGGETYTYQLAELTFGHLVAALQADGFTVTGISPEFSGLLASVLVEGSGDQAQSNGNQVTGFTNLLWSLLGGYARELRAARDQIPEALKQMVIHTAEGEWLDLWGALYNLLRADGQSDADYAEAIPREAFRERVNARAIEKAILELTGKYVRIEEPWEDMFRLDESKMSGRSRFYDGRTVGYHLIRPVSLSAIDWTDVLPIIERNRAEGVVVLPPEVRLAALVDGEIEGVVYACGTAEAVSFVSAFIFNRLDYMKLSAEPTVRNWYEASIEGTLGYTWLQMGAWTDLPWDITVAEFEAIEAAAAAADHYANTTLSEDMT